MNAKGVRVAALSMTGLAAVVCEALNGLAERADGVSDEDATQAARSVADLAEAIAQVMRGGDEA